MKILLASSFFPPNQIGGTEMRNLGYASILKNLGHEVQVVCAGDWGSGPKYLNGYIDEIYHEIPVRRVNINWVNAPDPNRYLYNNPLIEEKFTNWLDEWKPDIVHITSCHTLSASIVNAAINKQLPVILTLTDYWFICPRVNLVRGDSSLCQGRTSSWECLECLLWGTTAQNGINSILPKKTASSLITWVSKHPEVSRIRGFRGMALDMDDRKSYLNKMIQSVNCITAPSRYLAKMFAESGVHTPIKVIHSGHDLRWLETMPRKVPSDIVRFGYIGQIIPSKGVHILISAFVSASFSGKAELLIFGDQNQDPEYKKLLDGLLYDQGDGIKYQGAFSHDQLGQVLSQIDMLIVPSQWHENNPRVIQEAFASKTPVIASDVGGITEFVQNDINGLLFKMDSAEDLARQLSLVVANPHHISHLQSGINPTKTIEYEVNEIVEIYRGLIAEKVSDE